MEERASAEWGQDGERIARLRDAADFAIYTPGSRAGRAAVDPRVVRRAARGRARRHRADGRSGDDDGDELLALLGVDADPVRSREHILLSTILERRVARRARISIWRR